MITLITILQSRLFTHPSLSQQLREISRQVFVREHLCDYRTDQLIHAIRVLNAAQVDFWLAFAPEERAMARSLQPISGNTRIRCFPPASENIR